jgi:C4-dicarboxylate transporter, DctM subunit
LAFLILATPIFFPVAMKLGYDPVWFGIILAVVTMIGVVIPPLGINVFVVAGVTKEPINKIYRGVYPYVIGMTICLFIFLLFPELSLWLPNYFMQ